MATFGKINYFSEEEDWGQYTERLDNYFGANDVTDGKKKRAILLSVCGPTVYKLMRGLTAPSLPKEKIYKQLTELVSNHRHPKPSGIMSRFKFNTRVRKAEESVASYIAELRHLTEHCKFGLALLSEMLRDRLVCGINDHSIQKRLPGESDLDFDKALGIATSMEAAAANARDLSKATQQTDNSRSDVSEINNVSVTGFPQKFGNEIP